MQSAAQLFLRLAIGTAYFIYGTDRLGLWGNYGDKNISWGDWKHFMLYARQVMHFLPAGIIPILAAVATACEITFGLALVAGFKTRWAALGSGVLSLLFAVSMTLSFGFLSPLGYGVFTLSAASFLLYTIPTYQLSLDKWLAK